MPPWVLYAAGGAVALYFVYRKPADPGANPTAPVTRLDIDGLLGPAAGQSTAPQAPAPPMAPLVTVPVSLPPPPPPPPPVAILVPIQPRPTVPAFAPNPYVQPQVPVYIPPPPPPPMVTPPANWEIIKPTASRLPPVSMNPGFLLSGGSTLPIFRTNGMTTLTPPAAPPPGVVPSAALVKVGANSGKLGW